MSRKNEYRRYLKSPEWQDIRTHALLRGDGLCEFCGDLAAHVHHVRYPKQFGTEHPDSTVAVCDKCHKTAHGIQKMKPLTNVEYMHAFAPDALRLNYLLSEGRVYASAASWRRALGVPPSMTAWFDARLSVLAMLKRNSQEELQRTHEGVPVYRWRAVVQALRNFSFAFMTHGFKNRPVEERREKEHFHGKYERLVEWGDDLQEQAMANALRGRQLPGTATSTPVTTTESRLAAVVANAVAPRLLKQEKRQARQDVIIQEIKDAVPALQPERDFITVKRAIAEKGLDASIMPLHPRSNETLSGLAGQMLVGKNAERGPAEIARVDGSSRSVAMNTYRRGAVYEVLDQIMRNRPQGLAL